MADPVLQELQLGSQLLSPRERGFWVRALVYQVEWKTLLNCGSHRNEFATSVTKEHAMNNTLFTATTTVVANYYHQSHMFSLSCNIIIY